MGEGAEWDKSRGIKPGRKFSEGTRSGGNEGRGEKLPILPFHSEPSKAKIRAKSSNDKLNGLQIQNVPGRRVVLLDRGINNSSRGAAGDRHKT